MQFPERSSGSKNFLKLKGGESARGVFQGDVYTFKQHWSQSRKTGVLCTGEDCPTCNRVTDDMDDEERRKHYPAFRFRLNFVVNENGAYTAKIFEQGGTSYDALKSLHDGGDYDLSKHLMKITRHGAGQETTYSITPVPNGMLDAEKMKAIKEVELCDLKVGHGSSSESAQGNHFSTGEPASLPTSHEGPTDDQPEEIPF